MATVSPPPSTPLAYTTRRGFATASFSLGFWSLLVFWWYPFGLALAGVAIFCGVVSVLCGFKARTGRDGENLAYVGIALGLTAQGMAFAAYRFMQLAFEGSIPTTLP